MLRLWLLSISVACAQKISIKYGDIEVDGPKKGFTIVIPYTNKEDAYKLLKNEFKSWRCKCQKMEVLFGNECYIKAVGEQRFYAYGKVVEKKKGEVIAYVAVTIENAMLSPDKYPKAYREIRERLYKYAKRAARKAVEAEIAAQEKVIKQLQNTIQQKQEQIQSNQRTIENCKKRIAEAQQENENLQKEITNLTKQVEQEKQVLEQIQKKLETIK